MTEGNCITEEKLSPSMEAYLHVNLKEKHWKQCTYQIYRSALMELQNLFPSQELLPSQIEWRDVYYQYLAKRSLAPSTKNVRLSAVIGWAAHYDVLWSPPKFTVSDGLQRPVISQEEFGRLLTAARREGRRVPYLWLKAMVYSDLSTIDLATLTMDNLDQFLLPKSLKKEIAAFAASRHISKGLIFRSGTGTGYDRANFGKVLRSLCVSAGVDPEKGSVVAIRHLGQALQKEMQEEAVAFQSMRMDQELAKCDSQYGWDVKEV